MNERRTGAANRQANRSASNAAYRRKPRPSIAAGGDYASTVHIAGWILGIAFAVMFAIGIIAG